MPETQITSSWWEEVLNYLVKSPISDISIENPQFDCQCFKMIAHINQYFHPSRAVDSLGYIFQLIVIKQGVDKPVIMLKAHLSCLFASLKMGGVNIDPPLQVRFMLRSLLFTYHGVVENFKLRRQSFTKALMETIVDQCISNDKDHWKEPNGKDDKVSCNPSVNAAGAPVSVSSIPKMLWQISCSINISTIDATIVKTSVSNVLYATTHPGTNPTMPKLTHLKENWSEAGQMLFGRH